MALPTITSTTPPSVSPGGKLYVIGTNFATANVTAVTFAGVSASFTIVSDTRLLVTVPQTVTTGTVAATNPTGTATSASVTVTKSRHRLGDVAMDDTGNVQKSGSAYVFASDGVTSASTNPPTGTAVTMYTANVAGSTQTNPITLDSTTGEFEVWMDQPGEYDVVIVRGGTVSTVQRVQAGDSVGRYGSIKEAPPKVYLSSSNVRASANDSAPAADRGAWYSPYASLSKIITDYPADSTSVIVEGCPGPVMIYTKPTSTQTPGATWYGQAIDLGTSTTTIPNFLRFVGPGGDAKEINNSETTAAYSFLFYGNVSSGPLITIGSSSGNPSSGGIHLEGFSVTNTGTSGRGIELIKGVAGGTMVAVNVFGCAGSGIRAEKDGADGFTYDRCKMIGNALNGTGYGFDSGVLANGYDGPNLVRMLGCHIRDNGVNGNGTSGEVFLAESDSKNGGEINVYSQCRIGPNGFFIKGRDSGIIENCYFETSDTVATNAIEFDVDPDGGTHSPEGWLIRGNRFHGWGTQTTTGVGRHVNFLAGNYNVVEYNYHHGNSATNAKPYVRFAAGCVGNEVRILRHRSVALGAGSINVANQAGNALTGGTNWGHVLDQNTNTTVKLGTWPV